MHDDIIRLLIATILNVEASWIRDMEINYADYSITCFVGAVGYRLRQSHGRYVVENL